MRKRPEAGGRAGPEAQGPADDRVRLSPILGIRPGVYLSLIYALILLGILFFLCLYPGLSRPGSLVSFHSLPRGAAIRVDGVTWGATPEEFFIDQGPHTVELVLPGFEGSRRELEVPGRRFFSLFFPRRLTVRETLASRDSLGVLAAAAGDYAAWSFTGEATSVYQIPLSLSEGVYRGGPALGGAQNQEAAELIRAAARFAVSQASLRDLSRAALLLDNGGLAPSPLSLSRSAGGLISWLSGSPQAAEWLKGLLPADSAALVRDSPWAPARNEGPGRSPEGRAGTLELAGLRFRPAGPPGGMAGDAGAFYYGENPAGTDAWDSFLEARPEWAPANLESLREQGLVNGDYLMSAGGGPRTGVSWYAAGAFCRWLNTQLPPGFEEWEVRLPLETEWEYAAPLFAGASPAGAEPSGAGVPVLWEWCADPYAPLRAFPAAPWAIEVVSSPERLLRSARHAGSRGSLPPNFCSPFAGFRPFIARRPASGPPPDGGETNAGKERP